MEFVFSTLAPWESVFVGLELAWVGSVPAEDLALGEVFVEAGTWLLF